MSNKPMVTVVMPVRNEARYIERSLGAVLSQDYPSNRMEVIVADGMSTDGTADLVRASQARHANLRLLENPGRIVATGLNAALSQAAGEIFVRVDGHCEIAADYLARCVEHLERGEAEGVGGVLETVGEDSVSRAIGLAMSSTFGVGGSAFRTKKDSTCLVDTVAFPAYTRAAVQRAGAFDEELVRNQDDEYNYRLRGLGGRILLAEDVKSRYYSRSSLLSLWRQYFQYGYWKVRVLQKHPRQMKLRQFAPPAFAGALSASVLWGLFGPGGWRALGILAGAYAAANLAASVLSAGKAKRELLPLLPAAFATLHLAYGFGFLAGLFRFAGRWGDRRTHVRRGTAQETEKASV